MPHKPRASLRSGFSATSLLPKSWPAELTYLTIPVISKSLAPTQLEALQRKGSYETSQPVTPGPCGRVRITPITSKAHPAYGQYGLYATQHLVPDTFIMSYLGFVHGHPDSNPASDYDLGLDRELGIGVDASSMGNEARFINDYRGIRAEGPNAEFRDCWVKLGSTGKLEKRIGVYVLTAGRSGKRVKGIAKGEEVLVSYGKGFWSHREVEGFEDTGHVAALRG